MRSPINLKSANFKFADKCWIFLGIAGVIFGFILFTALDIYRYGNSPLTQASDAGIVLGAEVWDDQPSPVFRERINHAINLYKQQQIRAIIFTGGLGTGKKYTEAEIGKQYAILSGVKTTDIFTETQSRTTFQNLEYAKPIVNSQKFQRVLIISDPLHLKRAVTMARNLGMNAYPSATPTTRYQSVNSQLQFLSREIYFYLVYLLFKL